MDYINKIFNMDCIAGMVRYPDRSIGMILSDLSYGVSDCRWDSLRPFSDSWRQVLRIIKDNGAIVLTAAQLFTTRLISSPLRSFRYYGYWYKNMATGFTFAKHPPQHRDSVYKMGGSWAKTRKPASSITRDNCLRSNVNRGREMLKNTLTKKI